MSARLLIWKVSSNEKHRYRFMLDSGGDMLAQAETAIPAVTEQTIREEIDRAAQDMYFPHKGLRTLKKLGQLLEEHIPDDVRRELAQLQQPLLIDAEDPGIPWELCHDGNDFLCARFATGRKPAGKQTDPAARIAFARDQLDCLVIAPAEDLPFAQEEARQVGMLMQSRGARVTMLKLDNAGYVNVADTLRNSRFSIIHITGHALVDADNEPAIVLWKGAWFTEKDIRNWLQGTPLVFANACQSGRQEARPHGSQQRKYDYKAMGLPYAFMNANAGRARAFIGTPWRIDEIGASELPLAFYTELFDGQPVGVALQRARQQVAPKAQDAAWAAFVLWGDPELQIIAAPETVAPAAIHADAAPAAEAAQPHEGTARPPQPARKQPARGKRRKQAPARKQPPTGARQEPPPSQPESEQYALAAVAPILDDGRLNRERLGPLAAQVLHRAELEMASAGSDFITTSHLFIGLTKIENGATQQALHHQGINPEAVRNTLRRHAAEQAELQLQQKIFTSLVTGEGLDSDAGLGFSVSVTKILQTADQQSRAAVVPIDERHLLLGFLEMGGGSTRKPLEECGVDFTLLTDHAEGHPGPAAPHPLFDEQSRLRAEQLAPEMRDVIGQAWQDARTGAIGYVATPHVLVALIERSDLVRRALAFQHADASHVGEALRAALRGEQLRHAEQAELHLYDLSPRVQKVLRVAHEEAQARGAAIVDAAHVLLGFVLDGGGVTAEVLREAHIDLPMLEQYVRRFLGDATTQEPLPPLFLPDGRLNLAVFAADGQEVLECALAEAAVLGVQVVDTRRLVLGLAGVSDGVFATALAEQHWDLVRLRSAIYAPRHVSAPWRMYTGALELRRDQISRRVRRMLEEAWSLAEKEGAHTIGEPHIARAFVMAGALWEAGSLRDLGLNTSRLRSALSTKSTPPVDAAASAAQGARSDREVRPMFEANGMLKNDLFAAPVLGALQGAVATARRDAGGRARVEHLLAALVELAPNGLWARALAQQGIVGANERRVQRDDAPAAGTSPEQPPIREAELADELLQLLDHAHRAAMDSAQRIEERHLLLALLAQGDRQALPALAGGQLDLERFEQTLAQHPLFAPDGQLLAGRFDNSTIEMLQKVSAGALLNGHEHVGTPHLFLLLVAHPAGAMQRALQRQSFDATELGETVRYLVHGRLRPRRGQIPLVQTAFSPRALYILRLADKAARDDAAPVIEERHLAAAFIQGVDGVTRVILEQRGVDLSRLLAGLSPGASAEPDTPVAPQVAVAEPANQEPADGVVFRKDGALNRALFDERALYALEQALAAAQGMKHSIVGTPHLVIGLTTLRAGYTHTALLVNELKPETIQHEMRRRFAGEPSAGPPPELTRVGCSEHLRAILELAHTIARQSGAGAVGERELLLAFLRDGGGSTGDVLEGMGVRLGEILVWLQKLQAIDQDLPVLGKLGRDLTAEARAGRIDQVYGRDREIAAVIEALSMKVKNNPLLVGDAGVGKTAIIEGLAQLIANGMVPEHLRGKRVIQLDVGNLVAGTMYRGQFEERVRQVLEEARRPEVILFIDEVHLLVGAGAAGSGGMDAGNLFKPALSRGEICVIGATTPQEAAQTIEKDSALERRFNRIQVNEPSREETLTILRRVGPARAAHYTVTIADDALEASIDLVRRYVPQRRMPDGAIEALDRACARAINRPGTSRLVDAALVSAVVADWAGVPAEEPSAGEQEQLLRMRDVLERRIIGQQAAVEAVTHAIWKSRAGLRRAHRPVGVLLFVGATGVGKTELAYALADELYRSREAVIRLDMSEYQEQSAVSKLIGAAPGYIGYHDDGQLTGPLRRRPASIVLLDEIDKVQQNAGILDLFLQLFDSGAIKDGQGRSIDGRNALFILTGNVPAELLERHARIGFSVNQPIEERAEVLARLRLSFRPEFLNRIDDIVVFRNLDHNDGLAIVRLELEKLRALAAERQIALGWDEQAVQALVERGFDRRSGARALQRAVEKHVADRLGEELMRGKRGQVLLTVADGQFVLRWEAH
jgi:ATP-dependent Clp protease ATP-binding subunit ClpA/CHAT domain-containing protein